jgi:hypothetical protein
MSERAGRNGKSAGATDPNAGTAPPAAGPDDPTQVFDQPRSGSDARLIIIAGPKAGSEYTLGDGVISIGRGTDNQIVIPDLSVSRKHVTVEKTAEGWSVRDLGSGNGTRVNGKDVTLHALRHGDEVAVGDSVVRFVEQGGVVVRGGKVKRAQPAAAPERAPAAAAVSPGSPGSPESGDEDEKTESDERTEVAPAPRRPSGWKAIPPQKRRFYAAAFAALGLLLVLGVARQARRGQQARRAAQMQEEREARRLASEKFDEARALIKDGKWTEAKSALVIAKGLAPDDPEVQRYLARAEQESEFDQKLRDAKLLVEKADFEGARALVAAVTPDSALAEQAEALRKKIEESALAHAEQVAAADAQAAAAAKAARPGKAPEKKEAAPALPAPRSIVQQEVAAIVEAYRDGDLKNAMDRADEAADGGNRDAGELKRRMGAFDAARREGLSRAQGGKPAEAARALEQALKFDKEIVGARKSKLGLEVGQELSRQHFLLGMEARGDEQLGRASQHFRAAVDADPSNDAAQRQLEHAVARAKELYLEGYVARTTDPETARRIFKRVIQVLPPGDETYEKAKRWLDQLEGRKSTANDP